MAIKLIVSPPASGKTEYCLQRINEVKLSNPLANIWVLVPDRLQAEMFQRRLAAAGDGVNKTIETFRDLYINILERNGIFVSVVTANAAALRSL